MIGIIPAAGNATRMGGIPKMLLPIPGSTLIDKLIARMTYTLPDWKLIIVSTEVTASLIELHTNCPVLKIQQTNSMSQTLLAAYARHREPGSVLFGMPDTYFDDDQAFVKLVAALDDDADVAVGLFKARTSQRRKLGMCDFTTGPLGKVTSVVDKPEETNLTWAWGVLAWKPIFWQFIKAEDPHVGYALPRAIEAGLDVRAVRMDGEYYDCGTPDEYFECIEHLRSKTR